MQDLTLFLTPIHDNKIAIVAVLCFILLDVAFGLINAVAKHEYKSSKMREGIGHKSAEVGIMVVGAVVDACINAGVNLGFDLPVLASICVYLCLMEIGSLLETFSKMNPALKDLPIFNLLNAEPHLDETNQ